MKPTDEWGWKQSEKVRSGSGLLAAWAGQGYRLPDPRREEDFALHLRLMEAAFFGDRHAGFGLENGNSAILDSTAERPALDANFGAGVS